MTDVLTLKVICKARRKLFYARLWRRLSKLVWYLSFKRIFLG